MPGSPLPALARAPESFPPNELRGEARQPRFPPGGAARPQVHARGLADQLAPLVVVGRREQVVKRHVGERGVAVPGLAVGEGELARLGHRVDEVRGSRAHRGQVVAVEQGELLQEDRALAPGTGLGDGQPVVVVRDGRLQPGAPGRQVLAGEQAAVPLPGHVHHLGGGELADLLGDEAVVPGATGGLELPVAIAARRLRLGENAGVGGGERSVGEPAARRGHAAARQVHLRRRLPVLAEQVGDAGDRPADRGDQRIAVLRVTDRVAQHVAEPERAVLAQQQQPAAERARHGRGEQPAARHQVEAEARVRLGGRGGGRGALAADHERLAAPSVVPDDRHLAGRSAHVRLDDLEGEPDGDRRVERVAALLKYGHARRRREPVRRRHHPEGPRKLRPRGELWDFRHRCTLRPLWVSSSSNSMPAPKTSVSGTSCCYLLRRRDRSGDGTDSG